MSAPVLFSDAPARVGPHGPLPARGDLSALTALDLRVLDLAADGLSNSEISERVHYSPSVVRDHLERLCAALGASNRGGMVGQGYRSGLLARPDPVPDGRGVVTREQHSMLALIARGATNAEIADELELGVDVVKSRLGKLFAALGARGREHAVRRAVDLGVLRLIPKGGLS